jgi:hypothetical protein
MTLEQIQQAITQLPPGELARFRAWFVQFEREIEISESNPAPMPSREFIRSLRGSIKGSEVMKAFMKERRRER